MQLLSFSALVTVLLFTRDVLAVGSPNGYASGTTGGAGGVTVTPTTQAELITYLSDSTARTVILNKIFDFTNYYGTTTATGCKAWTCSNGLQPQLLLATSSAPCGSGVSSTTVTLNVAGYQKNLAVGSNKTVLGQGSNAGLKGIGLTVTGGASNVIIQNIKITDLNPQYVWGGDAIRLDGSSRVWIDHNYFARVGRQFICTGFGTNTGVTISNNVFDGQTSYSASCNNQHYWAFLLLGTADTLTLVNNYIHHTSGRGPHIGGYSNVAPSAHLVNNYYENVSGHALDTDIGSSVLAEGNYFKSVTTPDTKNTAGQIYLVVTVADAGACTSYLGRVCEWNRFESSGTTSSRLNTGVFSKLNSSVVKNLVPKGVADVPAYVLANAGVGKVN